MILPAGVLWKRIYLDIVDSVALVHALIIRLGLCSRVFTQKGKPVAFAELSDLFGPGFIIDGDRIRGKNARCAIKSRKQEGDSLELTAACATTNLNSNVLFSLKVIDDNNLSRSFPEIPGMTLKYTRCSL
jgi:hypothetical protein